MLPTYASEAIVIVKRNFSPVKVLSCVWLPLAYATAVSVAVVVLRRSTDSSQFVVPFAPVGTLGAALAIFVAFRNNASYGRWWEARTVWGGMAVIAADQGVASAHAIIGDQQRFRDLLHVPDTRRGAYLLALGYPASRPLAPVEQLERRPLDDVVHRGRW